MTSENFGSLILDLLTTRHLSGHADALAVVRLAEAHLHRDDVRALRALCREHSQQTAQLELVAS